MKLMVILFTIKPFNKNYFNFQHGWNIALNWYGLGLNYTT